MTTANFNSNDTLYAGANGVVIWKSLDRPLIMERRLQRGNAVTVAERRADGWLLVTLSDGTPGFVQANALTATPYVAPASAAPTAVAPALATMPASPQATSASAAAPPTAQGSPPTPRPQPAAAAAEPDAFCRSCGRALVPGNAFCGGCGARAVAAPAAAPVQTAPPPAAAFASAPVDAAVPQPVASPPPFPASPAPQQPARQMQAPNMAGVQSAVSTMQNPDYLGYAIANLVLIISAFLPWEVVDLFFVRATGSGLDVNRGWIVLVTAVVAGAIAVWGAIQPVPSRLVRWAQFGAGITAIAMVFFEFNAISNYCGDRTDCEVGPGIGVFLAFLAALTLIALAIFRPLNRWRARQSVA